MSEIAENIGEMTSTDLSSMTLEVFEAKCGHTFGRSMGISFDQGTKKRLADQGKSKACVVKIGTENPVRLAIVLDFMSDENIDIGQLLDLQSIAERLLIDRIVLPYGRRWDIKLRERAYTLNRLYPHYV